MRGGSKKIREREEMASASLLVHWSQLNVILKRIGHNIIKSSDLIRLTMTLYLY